MKFNDLISTGGSILDLLYSIQQKNLIYNANFIYFSNRATDQPIGYGHPDGWVFQDEGGKIGASSNQPPCCIIQKSDSNKTMTFQQALHEFPGWEQKLKDNVVTAKVVLEVSTNCNISVTLTDGINSNIKTKTTTGATEFDLQLTLGNTSKGLYFKIESPTATATIKVYKAYANIGKIALENLPCMVQGIIGERKQYIATEYPPAEELSLCCKQIELGPDKTRLDSVINKKFGVGPNKYSLLPDIRGYFSRSWNNSSNNDPDATQRISIGEEGGQQGDHVGTGQEDAFKTHGHLLNFSTIPTGQVGGAQDVINGTIQSETQKSGGNETRPKNFSELYTIKWA